MQVYANLTGKAPVCASRGRLTVNWAGRDRKSGLTLKRIRHWIMARDSYTCQHCGKDCKAEYLAYLANPKGNRAPLVAAHLVSHKDNGLNGLNIQYGVLDGKLVVYVDDTATANDLRSCGFSDEDIRATLDVASYRADYDANNMEAWCKECNSAEADAIANGRGSVELLSKEEILKRVARAYLLNKAGK